MTEYHQDLNKLERTQLKRGYGFAMEDLINTISDMINTTSTVQEMRLFMGLSKRMEAMESMRFPEESKN